MSPYRESRRHHPSFVAGDLVLYKPEPGSLVKARKGRVVKVTDTSIIIGDKMYFWDYSPLIELLEHAPRRARTHA